MNDFEDIRPYRDSEVRPVIDSLLNDLELSRAMAKFKHPQLFGLFPGFVSRLVQAFLRRELKQVHNIHDVQIVIEKYLDKLIETTTSGLTHTGLDQLDPEKPYLFISNHRDITMDPALVNYMLYHDGFDTLQIACGDNLMKKPFLTDLMRLNKSFIVKRSLQGREKLVASKQLSAYIHYCIDHGENVWIAQREGRAKDGIDKTESAIIKMLHMADRQADKKKSLAESIHSLNIVPVSISYEYDPCDAFKAAELLAIDTHGQFEKDEHSDVQSILKGMIGNKGAVHVTFGRKIVVTDGVTAEDIGRLIDEQVIVNYKLQLVNYLALQKLQEDFMDFDKLADMFSVSAQTVARKKSEFYKRLDSHAAELQPYIVNMYAKPVIRQFEMKRADG